MDPVHQQITAQALIEAGLMKKGGTYESPEAQEYSRGVLWNDDPRGDLMKPDKFTSDWGGIINYGRDFMKFEEEAVERSKSGKAIFGPGEDMLARTHFGDLGFIHGMAADDNEKAEDTKRKVMMWAEFTTKIAKGEIAGDMKLSDLGKGKDPGGKDDDAEMKEIAKLFPDMKGKSVNDLFGIKDGKGDIQQRAMGSLLHMVQDSYAGGHSKRDADGKISSFHAYPNQDHSKHGHSDEIGEGDTLEEQLKNTPGASDAIKHSADILKMMHDPKMKTDDILKHLNDKTFALSDKTEDAGPGEGYEKEEGWWDKTKDWLGGKAKKYGLEGAYQVKEFGKSVGEKAVGVWDTASEKAGDLWDKAGKGWDRFKKGAGETLEDIKEGASNKWEGFKEGASNKWENFKEGASNKWEGFKEDAGETWDSAVSTGSRAVDTVSDYGSRAVDASKRGLGNAWDYATSWF
jgi:hypothetical protein